jgi:hypothetical protein
MHADIIRIIPETILVKQNIGTCAKGRMSLGPTRCLAKQPMIRMGNHPKDSALQTLLTQRQIRCLNLIMVTIRHSPHQRQEGIMKEKDWLALGVTLFIMGSIGLIMFWGLSG